MRRSYIAAHDGTEHGADAVALARVLAGPGGEPVRIVHVCRARAPWDALAGPELDPLRAERAQMREIEETLRLPGDPLPLNMCADSVARGLHDAAAREPAALLVLASAPGGAPGRTNPGATAQRLLHGAPCPVAVAPEGYAAREHNAIRVVGVAVDVDPESRQAIRHAGRLARRFGARLRIMTAIDPATQIEALGVDELESEVREAVVDRGWELLRDAVRDAPSDVGVETRLCHGPAGEALADATDDGVDLLVCGSRGYGPRAVVLLGTTTAYLIAHASCPVLVVPRSPAAATRPTTEAEGARSRMSGRRRARSVAAPRIDRRAP